MSDLVGSKGGYFPTFGYCDLANRSAIFERMSLVVFQCVIGNYKVHILIGLVAIIKKVTVNKYSFLILSQGVLATSGKILFIKILK